MQERTEAVPAPVRGGRAGRGRRTYDGISVRRWVASRLDGTMGAALANAIRAAIVAPAVFALARVGIGNAQTALFAVFATFATLIFAEFSGPRRARLTAYAALAGVGFPLIALGTACSRDALAATSAMALVGFIILFSGVVNGYLAAGAVSALLAFVLPVMIPAPADAIPARLGGWALGCGMSIAAVMLLWPTGTREEIRTNAAKACRALADCIAAQPSSDSSLLASRLGALDVAVTRIRRSFVATPYRPTGATGPTAALARLVNDIGWLRPFVRPPAPATTTPPESPPDTGTRQPAAAVAVTWVDPQRVRERTRPALLHEEHEVRTCVVEVLRDSAARLDGGRQRPDLDRLARAREEVGSALRSRLADTATPTGAGLTADVATAFDQAFRLRLVSYGARQIGVHALQATGGLVHDPDDSTDSTPERDHRRGGDHVTATATTGDGRDPAAQPAALAVPDAALHLAAGYLTVRAVWLRSSVRGAVGLAAAVGVGQLADLQNAFWVVLGTLSVLRSNALSTGSTVIRALAGTTAGMVVGGALVAAVGSNTELLWAVLPVAILLAAYAPRAISFAAGQAAFTVAVLVLFNLLEPSGWEIGLVRVSDVAIGCAISLGVGLLFWPRGAAGVVREAVATSYSRSVAYLAATVRVLSDGTDPRQLDRVAADAVAAGRRLDDAVRQYLAERSTARLELDGLMNLVAGATRVRQTARLLRTGHPLWRLGPPPDGSPTQADVHRLLDGEVEALRSWYLALGRSVVAAGTPPQPPLSHRETGEEALRLVLRDAARGIPASELVAALAATWTAKHLDTLLGLQPRLTEAATALSGRTDARTTD